MKYNRDDVLLGEPMQGCTLSCDIHREYKRGSLQTVVSALLGLINAKYA